MFHTGQSCSSSCPNQSEPAVAAEGAEGEEAPAEEGEAPACDCAAEGGEEEAPAEEE